MMPYLKQNEDIATELKALALFVVILAGTPNLVMILSSRKSITTFLVAALVGMASTHLVKWVSGLNGCSKLENEHSHGKNNLIV